MGIVTGRPSWTIVVFVPEEIPSKSPTKTRIVTGRALETLSLILVAYAVETAPLKIAAIALAVRVTGRPIVVSAEARDTEKMELPSVCAGIGLVYTADVRKRFVKSDISMFCGVQHEEMHGISWLASTLPLS
jgi:hypothetical protein